MVEHEKRQKLYKFMDYLIEKYIDSGAKFLISIWPEMTNTQFWEGNKCLWKFSFQVQFFILYTPPKYSIYIFGTVKKFKLTLKYQFSESEKRSYVQQENPNEVHARQFHTYIEVDI